eukprot:scaffold1722_cov380-Prasinococcus_capsulatus_cf.AAC.9
MSPPPSHLPPVSPLALLFAGRAKRRARRRTRAQRNKRGLAERHPSGARRPAASSAARCCCRCRRWMIQQQQQQQQQQHPLAWVRSLRRSPARHLAGRLPRTHAIRAGPSRQQPGRIEDQQQPGPSAEARGGGMQRHRSPRAVPAPAVAGVACGGPRAPNPQEGRSRAAPPEKGMGRGQLCGRRARALLRPAHLWAYICGIGRAPRGHTSRVGPGALQPQARSRRRHWPKESRPQPHEREIHVSGSGGGPLPTRAVAGWPCLRRRRVQVPWIGL